ncbi:DNA sulfur modification protein DndC [Streptoalloteichus tenebrarius]|uniref:DNA sulfur modification protein DndC n=1 Tax=Streptoalloteichus tenebrarius (strain ATCC 17920 / DSM 40477 / JCM 4838 / CBS 697.72 / NBRC 16177 / NCIMB 11028 / NRRL B-12390 / A12253. 1 / ISP 5477) TaxID=1933 RepID=A0ABT1I2S4_STRSD|nr:DNA phosphorothioation system sulfurtransferase DndC [Streptoalloteichus tenebrarius]MCP2262028.1 DNA sulfur modification protein DndC [Streptoalloteichus tenebrarius]BFF02151.1 DNA phosphorothioation system sulfurtransferase DndC [Streptoalloteichus tenebrarius]
MSTPKASLFQDRPLAEVVAELAEEIRELYTADEVPWVVGYSGGKDSTAVLQLVWLALKDLPAVQRTKPVHVISTDTLVENPVVSAWVSQSLDRMGIAAQEQGLPIESHKLIPDIKDTFWVNLIGRGYPAPRPKFRWCTERLKIKPSNSFIRRVVRRHGEAILVLGIRKAESQARARAMARHEKRRVRDRLSPNGNLPNSLVYSPIEAWSTEEVWAFLMQYPNPWGHKNKDLLTMYQGASDDSECPLVVDNTTPSCGDSRFGCWTCTLVEQDKSMTAMIRNDDEKQWMRPLLKLRNELDDVSKESQTRDFRRMNGNVQLFGDRPIPGPYKQSAREDWLRKLLNAQSQVRKKAPEHVRDIELISMAELHEIRRIWVFEKHEVEDSLPQIYEETTGEQFPGPALDEQLVLGAEEIGLLKEACEDDPIHFSMTRELLAIERKYRTMSRRAGLFEALEKAIKKGYYEDAEDALQFAKKLQSLRDSSPTQLKLDEETATNAPS